MCFVWISEQTVTFSYTSQTEWFFITEVVTARYTLSPYVTHTDNSLARPGRKQANVSVRMA